MSFLARTSARWPRALHSAHQATLPAITTSSRGFADQSENKGDSSGEVKQPVTGRTPPGPKKGAYPKILDEAPPPEPSQEVREHNQEFENRHDRAANKINPEGKDNVGKGFWSGAFILQPHRDSTLTTYLQAKSVKKTPPRLRRNKLLRYAMARSLKIPRRGFGGGWGACDAH
jgi:hypothetical protein